MERRRRMLKMKKMLKERKKMRRKNCQKGRRS